MLPHRRNKAIAKRRFVYNLISWVVVIILSLSLSGLPTWAQSISDEVQVLDRQPQQPVSEPEQPVSPAPGAPGLNDPREFEAFVDKFFQEEMSKTHIPGGAISVVRDGKVFFAKGYGYANVEQKIPVAADKTLFRVASLSKLFTATAAMQLYERGMLQLDEDVNQYLIDFQLKNPYPEPVKVAQLMTHTDGTSQRRIGLAARSAQEIQPLGDYLAARMPPIFWPPGKLYNYSSHSTALLGYLVQKISGLPFAEYIDKNIFQPLSMPRSAFVQPPPLSLAKDLAVGYQYQNGNFKPVPYLYLNIAPAASLQTTAIDMAHFAIAHLQLGRYENARILKPDTVRLMHQTHFTQHPLLPGTAYEFHERLENGIRSLTHLGSLRGYSSSLTLLNDQNIGIFTATNSFSGIHEKFLSQFFDRYFPVITPARKQPLSLNEEQLNRFAGIYRDLEYPRDTFAKVSAPFKHIKIEKGDNGTLLVRSPSLFFLGNAPKIGLIPVEPLLFQRANDEAFTGFGEDSSGRIAFAFNPIFPVIGTFERIHWYETVWVQLGIVGFCAVMFLSAAIIYPILPLIRRWRGKQFRVERRLSQAWILAGLIGTLNLVFLIGFPLSLWLYGVWKLVYGVPVVAIAFLCIPLLTTVLTLGLFIFTAVAWRNNYWSLMRRAHYSFITLAALMFIPFLTYWNFLGFQF
ncbi:serine hydrolase [Chroococcidiopsis sp. FACHB-1243]|uniref:serine hydrolase domain-containing protein n=1 Tax=Chroococcidiopsis sp. [FACHB-1243] TaxID=2692781 RepID=UPI0017834296|nr:serine hydrolase domain-containing protein [Chroococcidiopsis sp. [FACHB-1243]]MBD2307764.1 serine hydrolase [Chroococcidiopsis sp. [FACHB-1243]]